MTVHLKPYWGKPALRNFRGGRGNPKLDRARRAPLLYSALVILRGARTVAEGQAVFASDEATYDSVFNVPGVTFVANTGDYGGADPEYPAFSPSVLAVGGTSLTLNADNSYDSETGWGYYADSVGTFIGSGGGLSLYEPEPAYQQGVQSTGSRTTPDVSFVADPATGAGSPIRTTSSTATPSRSWVAPACRRRPGRACWRS